MKIFIFFVMAVLFSVAALATDYTTNGCWANTKDHATHPDNICPYEFMDGGDPARDITNATDEDTLTSHGWDTCNFQCKYDSNNTQDGNGSTAINLNSASDNWIIDELAATIDYPVTIEFEIFDDGSGANRLWGFRDSADATEANIQQVGGNLIMYANGGGSNQDSGYNPPDNTWTKITIEYNVSGDFTRFFINGVSYWNASAGTGIGDVSATATSPAGSLIWDKIRIWNGSRQDDPIISSAPAAPPPAVAPNSSVLAVDFSVNDFTLSSSDFLPVISELFNATDSHNLSILSSMQIEKLTGAGSNTIQARTILDGTIILTEDIRTVSSLNNIGVSGLSTVFTNVSTGEHNLTVEFARSGNGNVLVSDVDFVLVYGMGNDGDIVYLQHFNKTYSHSSDEFTQGFNFTSRKVTPDFNNQRGAKTFFVARSLLTKTTSINANLTYFINSSKNSPFWYRSISNPSSIGSAVMQWLDNSNESINNYTIKSRLISDDPTPQTATNEISVVAIDMKDFSNDTINSFSVSNEQTNISGIPITGSNIIANDTVTIYSGNDYLVTASVSFKSDSGTQTPTFTLNNSACSTQKQRTLIDSDDVGNAHLYLFCKDLTRGGTETFSLTVDVPAGETLFILDESLSGFELTEANTTLPKLPPLPASVVFPVEDNYETDILINFTNATGLQGENITFYNITLVNNNSEFVAIINSNNSLNNTFLWDISSFNDGFYRVNVEACDTGLSCRSGQSELFTIDRNLPIQTVMSPRDNELFTNASYIASFTCNDSNLFGYDFAVRNETHVIIKNSTRNLTTKVYQFNASILLSDLPDSTYIAQMDCLDGHTAQLINEIPVTRGTKSLTVEDAKIESVTTPLKIDYRKLSDRYTYDFNYAKSQEYIFKIKSQHKIYYRESSTYKGHFIMGNNWLDTEPYTPNYVRRISDNEYEISLTGKDFKFNSIGIINNVSTSNTWRLDTVNSTLINISPENATVIVSTNPLQDFIYEVFSEPRTLANCSIIFNENASQTLNTLQDPPNKQQNTIASLDLSSLGSGNHTYRYNCTETVLNLSKTEVRSFASIENTIDLTVLPIPTIEDALTIEQCPDTIPSAIIMSLIVIVILFFFLIALIFRLAFLGILASLMMIVLSWYFAPCLALFSMIFAGIGAILLIYFAFAGLGFMVKT